MKKLILTFALFFGLTVFSQEVGEDLEKRTPAEKIEFQTKRLVSDLSLNEEQTKQVRALVTTRVEKGEAKRAEMMAKRAERKKLTKDEVTEMKANRLQEADALKADMKKILTAEQFAKWEENLAKRKENFKEKMKEKKDLKRKK
jgi:periplasmic protein CpxP/Spy